MLIFSLNGAINDGTDVPAQVSALNYLSGCIRLFTPGGLVSIVAQGRERRTHLFIKLAAFLEMSI